MNNVSVFAVGSAGETTEWDRLRSVDVDVLSTAFFGTHALEVTTTQGSGSIVNVTSGAQSGSRAVAAYSATKGAIASLTYPWAMEVEGTGVRVNALSTNAQTRMADSFERYLGTAATGQNVGKAAEMNAPATIYLLSDLSAVVNGQVLRVDGADMPLMMHPEYLEPVSIRETWTAAGAAC